jgi:predicted lipoprotein with Yx(FWY)xxD motif
MHGGHAIRWQEVVVMRLGSSGRGRLTVLAALAAGALLLAACNNGGSTASAQGGDSSGSTSSGSAVGTATVDGVGTVLDTSKGLTLYYNTQEAGGKIVCTGSCAQAWPPMTVTGSTPAVPDGVSGTFGTVKRPDGSTQLTFEGFPLYTFSGDSQAGQATGQGLQGVWFAATASGVQGAMGTKNGGSSGVSNGYGY